MVKTGYGIDRQCKSCVWCGAWLSHTALCLALVLTWSSRLCHTHSATTEGHAVKGKPRLVREARLGSCEAALCLGQRHARALQRPNALRAPAAPYKLLVAAYVTA